MGKLFKVGIQDWSKSGQTWDLEVSNTGRGWRLLVSTEEDQYSAFFSTTGVTTDN